MAGGTGQARAAVLVERVVVLLLESLRGAGGSRAQGLRQLPVVEGAAVPRDPGLWREGVAGLRQLPLKPGGEGGGVTEEWGSALLLAPTPNQNCLTAFSLGCTHSRLGGLLSSTATTGAHPMGTQWGAEKPCAPPSTEDPKMEQQDNTWAITKALWPSGTWRGLRKGTKNHSPTLCKAVKSVPGVGGRGQGRCARVGAYAKPNPARGSSRLLIRLRSRD